jgi:methylglutaconyl-CoA hydratase
MSRTPESTSTDGSVALSVDDRVATVTFGHLKSNALPGAVLRALAATIRDADERHDAHVIVLRSSGNGAFCAGASFDELKAIRTEDDGADFFSGFAHVILALRRCQKFVVARIHGKAAGGGVGLAAAADYALAHVSASARLSELAIGIGPFVVGPAIEHRIGRGHYAAMSIDAEWRDARWCERVGLYAGVYETTDALDAAVGAMAATLAASSPAAMAALKRVLWEGTEHWEQLLFARAAVSGRLVLSDYTRQAIASFKR